MEHVKRTFEKRLKKYNQKKVFFAKVIAKWRDKGFVAEYEKYNQLLLDLEGLAQELNQNVFVVSEGQFNKEALWLKIKKFKEMYKMLNEVTKPIWRQWAEAIIIALVLAIILRHTIFSPYHVPTGSAEPNILVGDRI